MGGSVKKKNISRYRVAIFFQNKHKYYTRVLPESGALCLIHFQKSKFLQSVKSNQKFGTGMK